MVDEARQFFDQTFFSGQTVTPELASTGTGLVARAVQHCGIRDWIVSDVPAPSFVEQPDRAV
ncbi:hypothetical protein [Methylobacterium sp. 13MFTsu3.1M2]|uniref:hypothetical protein n=1 Tax=Methylobacterium sp. 13MFTsu3.1M2 TaxID=1502776 RepID=UPI001FCCF97D|nr:hypothetical protein [Methylobacterium sp. 13MFTsu3.1M2]